MLDPVVRNKIQMTKNTDDLVEHIPKKHLVKALGELMLATLLTRTVLTLKRISGGDNAWEWKYPPIVPGENKPQK
jgi:hypothetical protein